MRTASVKTDVETVLVSFGSKEFWRIAEKIIKGKFDRRIDFLKSLPLFQNVHRDKLKKLSCTFSQDSYGRGYTVFK